MLRRPHGLPQYCTTSGCGPFPSGIHTLNKDQTIELKPQKSTLYLISFDFWLSFDLSIIYRSPGLWCHSITINDSFWLYLGSSVQWLKKVVNRASKKGRERLQRSVWPSLCGKRRSKLESIHKYLCVSDTSSNITDVKCALDIKK